MDRRGVTIKIIRWDLGHNDFATIRSYILNNLGKQETTNIIVNALSEMNVLDVLKNFQNFRNEKIPRDLDFSRFLGKIIKRETGFGQLPAHSNTDK